MRYFAEFTIAAGLNPLVGTHIFEIPNLNSSFDNFIDQNMASSSTITSINPGTSFISSILANQYGYIREISVKIFPMDDPDFEKEIFFHNVIPDNQSGNLSLIGTLVDAKEILEKEDFGIRVELRLRDFVPETTDARIDFSFFAK